MASQVDVVIVGAGAAGLSAAKSAESRGLSFVLLEASHRIGGRAHTEDFLPGQPFDLGCHWMHSASLNPFVGIADRLGFRYRRESGWIGTIHHHGAFLDDDQVREVDALVDADEKAIVAAALHGDPAVADVMNLDSPWAPYHAYWLSLGSSCDPDQTGAADIVAYNETDEDWPVVAGYGALVAAWAADVPVTLDAAVQRVVMTTDGVDAETPLGTISGRTALITVSTNMLVSGRIAFEPELPSWKTTAAQELPLGVHNKIAMVLNSASAVIPESQYLTVMARDHDVPVALNVRPYGYDYVVGGTVGRFAAGLERVRSGCVGRVPCGAPQGRFRRQSLGLRHRPCHRHHLAGRSLDTRLLFRCRAGSGASARDSGAPGRRPPVLCRRSHVTGFLQHVSRRISDRSARHRRDRCGVERAGRDRVTTNHAIASNEFPSQHCRTPTNPLSSNSKDVT